MRPRPRNSARLQPDAPGSAGHPSGGGSGDQPAGTPEGREGRAAGGDADRGATVTDLLADFRDGDASAFQEIVGAYRDRLVHFFYRLCWDRDRSEDFTQELFMKLLRGAGRYQPQGKLSTFIFRVATNLWIDHYRSMRPQPRLYSLDQAVHGADSGGRAATLGALQVGDEPSPVDVAIDGEERAQLRAGLESLTEPHRIVFELAVYQQLPYAEIGSVLEIPLGTVKSRIHNSVRALKSILTERSSEAAAGDSFRPRAGGGVG